MKDIIARVKNKTQLKSVLSFDRITAVIADYGCASADIKKLKEEHPEKRFFLQLPDVLREKKSGSVKQLAEKGLLFDGIAVKNPDELGLLAEPEFKENLRELIGDAFLYAYNSEAIAFFRSLFPGMRFILSDELTDREAEELIASASGQGIAEPEDFIYKIYGYQPLMITNQCMNRNYAGCMKPLMQFADEKRNRFFISSECGQCYDIVYNGQPTVMTDKLNSAFKNILFDFTIEDDGEIRRILNGFLSGDKASVFIPEKLTRGHHFKGVQ